ncbi:hypothetical protein RB213_013532 [Colletotrichum asianum]
MGWGWVHDRSACTFAISQPAAAAAAVFSGQTVKTHFDAHAPRKAGQPKARVS